MRQTGKWHGELDYLLDSLLGSESRLFLSCAREAAPTSFRFNGLKHDRSFQEHILGLEGFQYEDSPIPGAFSVTRQPVPIGKSLSHFLGHIYIQDLGSMLPPLVLEPSPGDCVLDLCAAPGSKTTQLAAMMVNRGAIIANDVTTRRLKSLVFNLRRTGVANAAATKFFGQQIGNLYFERFDRVLLDAPCSALGTIGKSPHVVSWWTPTRSHRLAANQRQLIQSGLKALRPGGVLVYSTCTIVPEENEQVIEFALRNFPVVLESISLPGFRLRPGLTQNSADSIRRSLENSVRLYPFENPCEGFFIARLRKTESFGKPRPRRSVRGVPTYVERAEVEKGQYLKELAERFGIPKAVFERGLLYLDAGLGWSSRELGKLPLYDVPIMAGLPLAHLRDGQAKLTTEGSHLFGGLATRNVVSLEGIKELESYLHRVPISTGCSPSPQVLISFRNSVIGHAIVDKGQILSRIPRVGWRFSLMGSKDSQEGKAVI